VNPLPLPPPPGAQLWSAPAPRTSPTGGSLIERPAWRQGRPGWALLHMAIAFGIAFVAFIVAIIIGMIGRTQAEIDNASDGPVAMGTLLVLGSSIVGWICFAYLDRSLGQRWLLLAASVGGSCIVAAALFSIASR